MSNIYTVGIKKLMYIIHYPTYQIMKLVLLSLLLYVTYVNGLNPVCRGKLRSDLQFKYSYDSHIVDSSKDLDYNQRGNLARCASSGTQIYTDSTMGSVNCDSIATGEGPGLDRFGWASQTMVGKEGSVKFYTPFDSLASVDQEFTTGTKCGTKVVLPTGAVWGAAVCEKAVHLYFYDDTQWLDRGEIAFPDATGNDIDIDVNHEDYLIARAGSKVFIYKLGMFPEKIHEENGDGLVAASVNCKGSVVAYESGGSIKLKQLDQSDGTSWSDLADVASSAISMEMSSDVLAVGTTGKVQLYLFANSGTEYAEYKAIDGLSAKNFGKKLALKHDDLAVADDDNIYLFKETTSTKCRQNQKLVNGECAACEGTESSALDTTSSTCTPLTCSANQKIVGGACVACPGDYTSAGGAVTECVCAAGRFIDANSDCTACPVDSSSVEGSTKCSCTLAGKAWDAGTGTCASVMCSENEHIVSHVCTPCPAGTTNEAEDDSSGTNTTCDAILCAVDEHVSGNACVACPAGSSNAKDDDASGADTTCDPTTTCAVDQFYNATSETCIACPAGSNKAVAVTSIDGDSTCDTIICPVNFRVSSNLCVPCSAGSESAGGDEATGADTFCACPADSRVAISYASDNTKKYGSTACTSTSDCGTKCGSDSACLGYTTVTSQVVMFNYGLHVIQPDGTVDAWGPNTKGELGGGDATNQYGRKVDSQITDCIGVGGGTTHTCYLKSTGTIHCVGDDYNGAFGNGVVDEDSLTLLQVSGITDATKFAMRNNFGCALLADKTVKCWGVDYSGQLGDGTTKNPDKQATPTTVTGLSDVVDIATGFAMSLAKTSDGKIYGWGSCPTQTSTALNPTPTELTVGGTVTQMCGGNGFIMFLLSDGTVKAAGGNWAGPLGDGTTTDSQNAFVDTSITDVSKIACGAYHACAIKNDGKLFCWGYNNVGQVGDGTTTTPVKTPKEILTGVIDVTMARDSTCAVLSDKTVKCWGENAGGRLGQGYGQYTDKSSPTTATDVGTLQEEGNYGPLISGTGDSFTKSKGCSTCGTNEERPAGDPTDGPETQCSCATGSEGDGSACQACPANSNSVAGHITSQCVKNEAAIWYDEVINNIYDAGACESTLDCTSLAGTQIDCVQSWEDGGVLQATTACCKLENPQKCACDENFRVASGVCTACTGGETRPAGDDPDGVNTYCSTEGIGLAFGHNVNDEHFTYLGQDDPEITLKVGQKYSFLRDTAGHPLRIVKDSDCTGCDANEYTTLPTSSITSVEAEQGVANIVWRPRRAGTYYYVCTSHPKMVGKLTVEWNTCNFPHKGAISLTESCRISVDSTLTGDMTINAPSARLRSTSEKPLLSSTHTITAGANKFKLYNVEITGVDNDKPIVKGTTEIILDGVDLSDNVRSGTSTGLFEIDAGTLIAQNMVITDSAGISFKGANGGDVVIADASATNSGSDEGLVKVTGGAATVRNLDMTGGKKLAVLDDATSLFEAVTMDGNEGIKGTNTAIQIERSTIKNLDGKYAIDLDNSGQDNKDKELHIVNSTIKDNRGDTNGAISVKVHSTTSYRSKIKLIEVDFSGNKKADNTARDIYSNNAASLYVVDPVSDPTISGPSLKEECYDHQCTHKPLASTCKVEAGKGTKCSCEVGVATYNSGTMSFERQTHLKEVLSTLFATADVGDRIVKLVDRQSRYTPASATPEEAKSNLILTKPTNTDGKFISEKTILMKPDSGELCTAFRTWLCNELLMCHKSDGTITAECDGTSILNQTSNAATRRLRSVRKWKILKAVHPDDPNCAGAITNLKQQCTGADKDGNAVSYERCVSKAHFLFNDCHCQDGTVANTGNTACIDPNDACNENQKVFQGRCVACEAGTTNIAGDNRKGGNTKCDDVVCATNEYADGTGLCRPCDAGKYNVAGDIALDASTGATITSTCCPAGEYETGYTASTGTRTCASCDDIKTDYTTTKGCCSGKKLGDATYAIQCPRMMEYWRNVCSQLDTSCPARNY